MFDTIKNIISVVSIVALLGTSVWGYNQKEKADKYYNNFYQAKKEWKDEQGRLVSEISSLQVDYKRIKNIQKRDSAKLSEADKQMKEMADVIESLNLKLKNVESYYKGELSVVNDSLKSVLEKDKEGKIIGLKPIKTEHLSIDFVVLPSDTVIVDHSYRADIYVAINRKRTMYTENGNKRFVLLRWILPRWQYWATARSDDKEAELRLSTFINFN